MLTKRLLYSYIFIALSGLVYFGLFKGYKQVSSDFPNYYYSGKLLMKGQLAIAYDVQQFNSLVQKEVPRGSALFIMYPPPSALIMSPAANLTLFQARVLWMLLSLTFLIHLVLLISKVLQTDKLWSMALVLLSGFALYNDFYLGQVYVFTFWMMIYGWYQYEKGNHQTALILWAASASLKYIALCFLFYLIQQKKIRHVLLLVFYFIMIHLITWAIAGNETYRCFFTAFYNMFFKGLVYNEIPRSIQYQTMEVWINNLFPDANRSVSGPAVILKLFWLLLNVFLSVMVIYLSRKQRHAGIITTATLIIFLLLTEKGSASYHLLFLIIPLMVAYRNFGNSLPFFILCGLYFLSGIMPALLAGINHSHNYSRMWLMLATGFYFYFIIANKRLNEIRRTDIT